MDKKMRIAILICVLTILASTFISARRGIVKLVDSAEEAFISGTDSSGYSIYTDLQHRAALARNLRTVASRYLDAGDKLLKNLDAAADSLEGERDVSDAYDANEALSEAVAAVDKKLSELALSETDENYRVGILADFASYAYTISHDGYNEYARRVNEEELSRFPANLFRGITFSGNIEYFE